MRLAPCKQPQTKGAACSASAYGFKIAIKVRALWDHVYTNALRHNLIILGPHETNALNVVKRCSEDHSQILNSGMACQTWRHAQWMGPIHFSPFQGANTSSAL